MNEEEMNRDLEEFCKKYSISQAVILYRDGFALQLAAIANNPLDEIAVKILMRAVCQASKDCKQEVHDAVEAAAKTFEEERN